MAVTSSSNPITSVPSAPAQTAQSIITSVPYNAQPLYSSPPYPGHPGLLTRLNLDLRGRVITVDREQLMLLPESVLLGLFPQGLVLSKPASAAGADDGIFTVDVGVPLFTSLRLAPWLDRGLGDK